MLDDAVEFRDMPTAHAHKIHKETYRRRVKVDEQFAGVLKQQDEMISPDILGIFREAFEGRARCDCIFKADGVGFKRASFHLPQPHV